MPIPSVTFPSWLQYQDLGLLALRLMVACVFFWSGLSHARDPKGRGESIGSSAGFALFLGIAEMAGAVGVALGILTQFAALGLMLLVTGGGQLVLGGR
jgi:putative oxidoreductase